VELPTPAAHGLSTDATIAVPVPVAGLTLHRLLEHAFPRERDFEPTLSRNQAKLRGVPELFRCSISLWLEQAQAVAASRRRTCFVARLELAVAGLTRVAATEAGNSGHVDVWGHPDELLRAVVNVVRSERRP
jgi:hypothetical protein